MATRIISQAVIDRALGRKRKKLKAVERTWAQTNGSRFRRDNGRILITCYKWPENEGWRPVRVRVTVEEE